MDKILRPNWVEVNLNNLKYNFSKLKKIVKKSKILFVVKADAYGHGIVQTSKFAEKNNLCDFFGVSSIEEGITLRESGIKKPIIILGSIYPLTNFKYVIEYDLIPTISSMIAVKKLNNYAKKYSRKVNIHIKVETGMNRIGISEKTFNTIISNLHLYKNLNLHGIYTHFSSADTDKNYTLKQFENYKRIISPLKTTRIIKHVANSHAAVKYSNTHLDMVRCGLALYGMMNGFKQILSWKTKIVFIKRVKKGSYVSYNKTYKTTRNTRIATLPVGYGDGYMRSLSNKGFVIVNGKKARIIGNITMDMMMIDVTDINCKVGDDVILTDNKNLPVYLLSKISNNIPYEHTTLITKRVPRVYVK